MELTRTEHLKSHKICAFISKGQTLKYLVRALLCITLRYGNRRRRAQSAIVRCASYGQIRIPGSEAVVAAAIDGPLQQPRAEILVVASSHAQGKIVLDHVLAFLGNKVRNRRLYQLVNSSVDTYLKDRQTGIQVRTCGSDSKRLHGAAPYLMIYDEIAQWPPNSVRAMLAALETSRGKITGSRAIWIGTRPASADHPFAQALGGKNKSVKYSQCHAAREKDPPTRRITYKRANPALDHFPDLEKSIRDEAATAKANPELLPQFRALRLNMGVADHENKIGLVDADLYRACEVKERVMEPPYILGLDVS